MAVFKCETERSLPSVVRYRFATAFDSKTYDDRVSIKCFERLADASKARRSMDICNVYVRLAHRSIARWANVIVGVLFTLAIIATLVMDSPLYYKYFGFLEVILTIYVVWAAFKWPGQEFAR